MLHANTPSRCVMALIRGLNGICECPICLATKENMSCLNYPHKPRSMVDAQKKIEEALRMSVNAANEYLKQESWRPVKVSITFANRTSNFHHPTSNSS